MILQQLFPTTSIENIQETNETLNFDSVKVITLGQTITIVKWESESLFFGSPFLHVFIVWLFVFLDWYSSPYVHHVRRHIMS